MTDKLINNLIHNEGAMHITQIFTKENIDLSNPFPLSVAIIFNTLLLSLFISKFINEARAFLELLTILSNTIPSSIGVNFVMNSLLSDSTLIWIRLL